MPPERARSRRVRRVPFVVAGVLLLIAGGAVALGPRSSVTPPGSVVTAYFDALRTGTAADILRYADQRPNGNVTNLSDPVLARQRATATIDRVEIGPADTAMPDHKATVPVQYDVVPAGARRVHVTDRLTLRERGRRWRLTEVAATITAVRVDADGARARLAGYSVPATPFLLFPGAVPITVDDNDVQTTISPDVVGAGQSYPAVQVHTSVAAVARTGITSALTAAMNRCLTASATPSCPVAPVAPGPRAVPGSFVGTVGSMRLTEVAVSGPDGLITVTGQARLSGHDEQLAFDNVAQRRTAVVARTFHASFYGSAPSLVRWGS